MDGTRRPGEGRREQWREDHHHNQRRRIGDDENHQHAQRFGNTEPQERMDPRQSRGPRKLGYRSLEAMTTLDPAEIVFKLTSPRSGFVELLKETEIRRDIKALIVTLLGRACLSRKAPQSLIRLLNIANESFLSIHLIPYVTAMPRDFNPRYTALIPQQVKSMSTLLMTMLQRLPKSADTIIAIVILLETFVPILEARCGRLDDETKETLKKMVEYHQEMIRRAEEDRNQSQEQKQIGSAGPPPDDFREISIFPTADDLKPTADIFLRQNKERGGYEDVDHYLDVQFRLLREDFVRPLRNGIEEYLRMTRATPAQRNQRPTDIRIYRNVQIQYPSCSWDGIIYRVHFDQTGFRRVRWQATKRLIYGSLVCLSKDDFQTFVFATVANRNPVDLEQGLVDLRFEDRRVIEDVESDSFVMAETSSYFEAYRHVLEGLKEITEDTLCFQKYIVHVEKEVDPPEYLQNNRHVTYNLQPLMSDQNSSEDSEETSEDEEDDRAKVKILDQRSWPTAEELHLDKSQLDAVKMALTKELSVIQGPPGTGKTYIGLKIVQALLHNSRKWNVEARDDVERGNRQTRPLLIVCYTNHALDQFLEGILEFQKSDIVRIGGRSSSEALKPFNLNSLKQEIRKRREVQQYIFQTSRDISSSMGRCRHPMEEAQARINATRHAVLNEDSLFLDMAPKHFDSLVKQCPGISPFDKVIHRIGFMLIWLGLDGSGFHVAGGDGSSEVEADIEDKEDSDNDNDDQIEEEANTLEEQRRLDDQDLAANQASRKGFDINTIRSDFALDVEAMNAEEQEATNEHEWQQVRIRKGRMKKLIRRNLESKNIMTRREADQITNVWAIPDVMTRWRLYRHWTKAYCDRQTRVLYDKQEEYEQLAIRMKEVRTEEDLAILSTTKVIGVTTTGAAKYRSILQRVKPRIVVVEEAAEVLESHVISTLSNDCQHLILIGDHQQLRPNPTVYELAKDYNMEVSLFERMINNGLPFQRLTQQHRMRPDISSLMKLKHFYPTLQDHISVRNFKDIKGVESNVFFIDHDKLETYIDDTRSHSNQHEADFLVSLSRYFLQQGYDPAQITILTTYTAQLFNFKRSLNKHPSFKALKNIRVCAVDNFQGEENDIILLSLVRSNEQGSIGFLKVANRVCVALSRARKGLFCIGNFTLLASKGRLWQDIVVEMKAKGCFGKSLKLVCRNHPQQITEVITAEDFLNVPEGGCNKQCVARLHCGHACAMSCHPQDMDHKEYKCLKPCGRVIHGCPRRHRCKKFCSQECDKRCLMLVEEDLPCGHTAPAPCHLDPELIVCSKPCQETLDCGHRCKNQCGEECTEECEELVQHRGWPCRHEPVLPCSATPEDCSNPCVATLMCGHKCSGTCSECQRGRLHKSCEDACNRTLVCGHICHEPCTKMCPPCQETCTNRCVHSRCQDKCGNPCVSCQEPCEWRCKHKKCNMLCSEPCDRTPCNEPCGKRLRKCRHPCIGVCGEPCPTKCRICDKDEVTDILFGDEDEPDARFVQLEDCIHFIEVNALDNWMKMADQTKTGKTVGIQLKWCPKCKTIIRRNLRYGNIIKQMLSDIETVKKRMFGDELPISRKVRALLIEVTQSKRNGGLNSAASAYMKEQLTRRLTLEQVTLVENQFNLLSMIESIRKNAEEGIKHATKRSNKRSINRQLNGLEEWLMEPRMRISGQQLDDVSREIQRLSLVCQMVAIESRLLDQGRLDHFEMQTDLQRVKRMLTDGFPLTDDKSTDAQRLLKRLDKMVGGLPISDKERVSIVKAMGLPSGHYFKCPKGHIYVIGDCGGATEEGVCPDCKSVIGGRHHTLQSGNTLAPEMDNAAYPAWSDQANLANYQLDDI